MFTSAYIRRYINRLAPNTIFSTKDLLEFGNRTAIDKALSRLVKQRHIIRITRGLFRREDSSVPLPTPAEVAKYKARSFDKKVITEDIETKDNQTKDNRPKNFGTHKSLLPNRIETSSNADRSILSNTITEVHFATNGPSSSFRYGDTIIKLRSISPRKFASLER